MDTYFAQAERLNQKELNAEIAIISNNPVMSGLLHTVNGLLAILDEHTEFQHKKRRRKRDRNIFNEIVWGANPWRTVKFYNIPGRRD